MHLRETRKRRNSAISNADVEASHPAPRTRSQVAKQAGSPSNGSSNAASTTAAAAVATPLKARKKLRFSDPGPSTGLTPALMRTSFDNAGTSPTTSTPSGRAQRRRSTALCRSSHLWSNAYDATDGGVVQFTPLRQVLDSRTQRRIRRTGLSNEINSIEREKRDAAGYEKTLQSLRRERDILRRQLEAAKSASEDRDMASVAPDDISCMTPRERFEQLQAETSRLREDSFSTSIDGHGDGDTFMLNDATMDGDAILLSDSPDMRGVERRSAVPEGFSLIGSTLAEDTTQVHLPNRDHEDEFRSLTHDLETARKERRHLFDACRTHISSLSGTPLGDSVRQTSPPPDFLGTIVPTLVTILSRASDATQSLELVKKELSQLGFSECNPVSIISQIRSQFREACIELERAVPGETPNVSINDANATLGALVKRIEVLIKSLNDERSRHDGTLGREQALKDQFEALLKQYEAASKKIHDLENSSSLSASDMLHTRMRMQELENEGKEQSVGISRLNVALSKYREEVSSLETLVTRLEEEKDSINNKHRRHLSALESRVNDEGSARRAAENTVAEQNARIRDMEQTMEHNRMHTSDLSTAVESLTRERQQALEDLERQSTEQRQHHEHELGTLNVRISELNTALQEANTETDVLRRNNAMLQEQLQLEVETRDNLLDKWAADQARSFALMKETVSSERRKAKVRAANFELKYSSPSLPLTIGNGRCQQEEPITPVSMSRHIDVEVGRGKHRRRLDSGIGILSEEELLEEINEEREQDPMSDFVEGVVLPSDPACL